MVYTVICLKDSCDGANFEGLAHHMAISTDDMFSVGGPEGNPSSGWTRSSDQSGITGTNLESISYANLGQIIANSDGSYKYDQMVMLILDIPI